MKTLKFIISLIFVGLSLSLSAQDAAFFKKYADKGDKEAMYNLADCYFNGKGGVAQDINTGIMWLSKSAKKNYAPAQRDLAICYLYGLGVLIDYKMAWELLNKAQKKGDADATYYIAQMYKNGQHVPKSATLYISNLKTAAQAGSNNALAELGHMYLLGDKDLNIYQDKYTAVQYLQKAAEQNNSDALLDLGFCYRDGVGGLKSNLEKSFEYIYKAAEAGNTKAYCEVGMCYLQGYGTEQNYDQAFKCLSYAAQQGIPNAYKKYSEICIITAMAFRKIMQKQPNGIKKLLMKVMVMHIQVWQICTVWAWV
ncbi:MAG: SEL1-like repeat protein [Muribaculaceae bacterium]|nr:SEL1-like repeat protein [Muribaculaceae bacterium]